MEARKMSGTHEPREEFVNQLELRLRADLRQQERTFGAERWMPRSRLAIALAVAGVSLLSMTIGGAVVAATYEASLSEQREALLGVLQERAALAKQRLALASEQLRSTQERVSIGLAAPEAVLEAQFKVREAEAELKSTDLDIAEVQAAGREPMTTVSAPLVAGRDFVTERLKLEMSVPAAALEVEKARQHEVRARFEVGLGSAADVEAAGARVIELESALEVFRRKLEIRKAFLKGGVPPAIADLRGLEAEADLRRTTLGQRVEFARRQVQEIQGKIDIGTADPLKLAEARLHLQQLELERSKAELELLLIRKQMARE
jgi:hypothetical protein